MLPLHGNKVLLGVTGGIASYKSAVLARRLIDAGAEVQPYSDCASQRQYAGKTCPRIRR